MREVTRAIFAGLLVAFLVAAPAALAESPLHQARAAGQLGRPVGDESRRDLAPEVTRAVGARRQPC
jgi:Spy/CpxP family protein refolding chaperone